MKTIKPKIRYYWCVNCGHGGDYGYDRSRGLVCEKCKYDLITKFSEREYKAHNKQKGIKLENKNGL